MIKPTILSNPQKPSLLHIILIEWQNVLYATNKKVANS